MTAPTPLESAVATTSPSSRRLPERSAVLNNGHYQKRFTMIYRACHAGATYPIFWFAAGTISPTATPIHQDIFDGARRETSLLPSEQENSHILGHVFLSEIFNQLTTRKATATLYREQYKQAQDLHLFIRSPPTSSMLA